MRRVCIFNRVMYVRIIMVEPHEAGNVGAAARAMKNFGFTDLTIVGSRELRTDTVSQWWAAGADDLVAKARRVDTLEEALADVHLAIATTAVRGRHVHEQLTPSEAARVAEETLTAEQRLAIVFGREEWGLSGREVALCQRTASIPTSPEFATMNLAQSVAIFCYELGKGLRPRQQDLEPATGELQELLHSTARTLLEELDFFGEKNADRMYGELRALAGRATLTTREASMLLSAIRRIRKALGRESPQEKLPSPAPRE
jgi:tRNA/rRNA methyltransferase